MDIIEALILGIVQGITEFLPISSSAHIIVVPWLFGWDEPGLTFNVAVHIGTLLAVLLYFRADIYAMAIALPKGVLAGTPLSDPMSRLALIILVGSIPAGLVGVFFEDTIDSAFHSGGDGNGAFIVIAVMLIVVGLLLYIAERCFPQHRGSASIGWRDGIAIGIAQAIALIPGTSRSGATITVGMALGLKKEIAARFSFLLGIPAIAGAGLLEAVNLIQNGLPADERLPFVVGGLSAVVVGYVSIAFLLRFLQTNSVLVFTLYRIALGVLMLALIFGGWL